MQLESISADEDVNVKVSVAPVRMSQSSKSNKPSKRRKSKKGVKQIPKANSGKNLLTASNFGEVTPRRSVKIEK